MKLSILILNREELLETLLEGFLEIGITGATVIDSVGMGHIVSSDIPIFAGLRFMFAGSRPYNKTILSLIDDSKGDELKHLVQKVMGPMNKGGSGILFFIDVVDALGLKKEL